MKRFESALLIGLVVSILISMNSFAADCRALRENTLRIHILANSDSEVDQQLKLQVRDAILEEARRIAEEGIPEADFLRMKRSALGRRIRALDSFDSVCFRVCAYHFSGYDYFRFPELYEGITVSHIQQFLKHTVTPERMCLCVVNPKNQEVM